MNNQTLPAALQTKVDDGTLIPWGKYNHIFMVKGIKAARIIWKPYGANNALFGKGQDKLDDAAQAKKFSDVIHQLGYEIDTAVYADYVK